MADDVEKNLGFYSGWPKPSHILFLCHYQTLCFFTEIILKALLLFSLTEQHSHVHSFKDRTRLAKIPRLLQRSIEIFYRSQFSLSRCDIAKRKASFDRTLFLLTCVKFVNIFLNDSKSSRKDFKSKFHKFTNLSVTYTQYFPCTHTHP
jgi:hypothetical protein